MMRSLLFVSCLTILWFTGCTPMRSGCRRMGEEIVNRTELPGVINTRLGVNKFNLQIDIAKKHFSGLLLVKQMEDTNFRTVFTTHFGMRIFDFEFIGDSLVVHYCIEPMQKEKIILLFQNDFSRLWGWQGEEDQKVKVYGDRETNGNEVKVYQMERGLFFRKALRKGGVEGITSGRRLRRTIWKFDDFQDSYPNQIEIRHSIWPIALKLERL